ncbi:MAG: glycosyltransferase [Bryobacteraceae bacterium]|jgi:glycosyltransferase involved in cell wall biosynthesis
MIEDNDIICFCNDWDGDPLSKKQIVSRLAQKNRVLWVNSTGTRNPTASVHDLRRAWKKLREFSRGSRRVSENISLFCPLVIPFHGSRLARWVNRKVLLWSLRRICGKLGFARPITLTFVPSSADVAGSLGERILIYYCVDEYSEFTGTDRAAMLDMERRLMEKSDLVIVSASRLHETKQRYNPNTLLITHGVDVTHFRKACLAETPIPEECSGLPHPVVGFFGLIADWVDLEVIRSLACARPDWSFVLIGEARTDTSALKQLPNVYLLGRRSYEDLPGYCKAFDAAILPFLVSELTIAANPLKLREYLAAGLPVVATPLPEVQKLGHLVHMARSPAEYLTQLEILLEAGDHGPSLARSLAMDAESWDGKVEQLSTLIQGLKTPATPRQLA